MTATKKARRDAFARVHEAITESLKKGVVPWRKPWTTKRRNVTLADILSGNWGPANWVSKKQYRGVNAFVTGSAGYDSRFWLSFKQADALGGYVQGKATSVVFWKISEYDDPKDLDEAGDPKRKKSFFLRFSNVWNTDECWLPEKVQAKIDAANAGEIAEPVAEPVVEEEAEEEFVEIEAGEIVLRSYFGTDDAPKFGFNGSRAYYSHDDRVSVPRPEQFDAPDYYYSTVYHEIAHSTGAKKRLDRLSDDGFGSHEYSKEELVAEMTAAILSDMTGMNHATVENSAAYIQNWLSKLDDDPKMLVYAGGAAQKAVDFVVEKIRAEATA